MKGAMPLPIPYTFIPYTLYLSHTTQEYFAFNSGDADAPLLHSTYRHHVVFLPHVINIGRFYGKD